MSTSFLYAAARGGNKVVVQMLLGNKCEVNSVDEVSHGCSSNFR